MGGRKTAVISDRADDLKPWPITGYNVKKKMQGVFRKRLFQVKIFRISIEVKWEYYDSRS